MFIRRTGAGLIAIAAVMATPSSGAAIDLRTIAITGAPAAGAPPGAVFWYVGNSVINDSGDVAFIGDLDYDAYQSGVGHGGVTGFDNLGVWKASAAGAMTLLARESAPAPGGGRYYEFERPHLDDLGQVALQGTLAYDPRGVGINQVDAYSDESLWLAQPGLSLQLVGREGRLAPGTGGDAFWSNVGYPFTPIFQNVLLSDAGQLVFHSRAGHASEVEGIWGTRADGTLGLIVRQGDTAPGGPSGARFLGFGTWEDAMSFKVESHFDLNDQGQLAFQGEYSVDHVYQPFTSTEGIWVGGAQAPLLNAAMEGQAPGSDYRPIEWFQWDVKIGEHGETAFWSNPDGLALSDPAGQIRFLVSPGDPIPDSTDRNFHPWSFPIQFSDSGELLFVAREDPGLPGTETFPIDQLLMRGDHTGALDILLDEERPISFGGVDYGFRLVDVESNGNGDVIALLRLFLGEDDSTARHALVTLNGDGTWLPLLMQGEQIEVEPGLWRTVDYIAPFHTRNYYSEVRGQRVLNDRGEFVLELMLDGNVSGVFVGMIPEPATGSLVTLWLIAIATARRRRSAHLLA